MLNKKKNFPKFTIELSRRVKFQMLMVLQVTLISAISLEEIFTTSEESHKKRLMGFSKVSQQ